MAAEMVKPNQLDILRILLTLINRYLRPIEDPPKKTFVMRESPAYPSEFFAGIAARHFYLLHRDASVEARFVRWAAEAGLRVIGQLMHPICKALAAMHEGTCCTSGRQIGFGSNNSDRFASRSTFRTYAGTQVN